MRRIAVVAAAMLAFASPARAQSDLDLLVSVCLEGAPSFESAEALALAAGGTAEAGDFGFADRNATLDDARHLGLWLGPATPDDDKSWIIGVSEGHLRSAPGRSCYGVQSVLGTADFVAYVDARWSLMLLREGPGVAGFGARETYYVQIGDSDVFLMLEWFGLRDEAFPMVRVIAFEAGALARAGLDRTDL